MNGARFGFGVRPRYAMALTSAVVVVVGLLGGQQARAATADAPVPVTPYSGADPALTRAPYVTDLAQTTAYVDVGDDVERGRFGAGQAGTGRGVSVLDQHLDVVGESGAEIATGPGEPALAPRPP